MTTLREAIREGQKMLAGQAPLNRGKLSGLLSNIEGAITRERRKGMEDALEVADNAATNADHEDVIGALSVVSAINRKLLETTA